MTRGEASLHVDGRVGRCGMLSLDRLPGHAPASDTLAVVEVLAHSRLSAAAEVLMVRGPNGASVALPVRAVLDDRSIRFVVDRSVVPPRVALEAPGWSTDAPAMPVVRMTAMTFAEFVMCR